jgi:hypothetical protein
VLVLVQLLNALLVDVRMAVSRRIMGVLMRMLDVLVIVLGVGVNMGLIAVLMLMHVRRLMGMGAHIAPIVA